MEVVPPNKLLQWQTTQTQLVQNLRFEPLKIRSIRTLAGVDVSYSLKSNIAVASLVIHAYPITHANEPSLYVDFHKDEMREPYFAGYLAFREVPILEILFARLRGARPDLYPPDVTLVDGHGVWHPRGLGSASHLGVVLDIAVIGVAKSFLHIPDAGIGEATLKDLRTDEEVVKGTDGKVYGVALRTGGSRKHVFVSCGHRVDLESAVEIVKSCSFYRIPEALRRADQESRRILRDQGL